MFQLTNLSVAQAKQ